MRLSEAKDLYLKDNVFIRQATRNFYQGTAASMIKDFGDFDFLELTKQDVKNMISYYKQKGIKNSTINKRITMLKTYINYLIAEDFIEPLENLLKISKIKKLPNDTVSFEPLNEEEKKAFFEYCTFDNNDTIAKRRNKILFLLNYYTGFRRSELLNIKCYELDFERDIIYIHTTKTSKPRPSGIPEFLKEELKRLTKEKSEYLFHTENGGQLKINTFDNLYKDLSHVLGFKISSHRLRHTYAVDLYNATNNLGAVQKLLGHTSLTTTTIYLNSTFEDALKKQKELYNNKTF